MKAATAIAAAVASLPLAYSLHLVEPRDAASPKTLNFDIVRKGASRPAISPKHRLRRRGTVTETLDNVQGTFYFANISLGTPAQKLEMTIDTGSSDLWTNAPNSTLCTKEASECADSGTYDSSKSSSYAFANSDFNISYADGSGAAGDYVTDTIAIGGQTLKAFEFGVGYESSSGQGVLGVGYSTNEAIVQFSGEKTYKNLPLAMVDAGLINTPAYSLWLNDLDASTGQILFGGVNTDKYTGDLATLPILPEDGTYAEFLITLTGLKYTPKSGSSKTYTSDLPGAVLLDSGSTFTYLPDDLVNTIYTDLNAQYDSQEGAAYISCDANGTLDFTFTSPTISVDLNQELLFEVTDSQGNPLTFKDGSQVCLLGLAPSGGSTSVLGDTFLRSAFVVYDLANNEISLAATDFNSTSNNIKEIASGTSGVPGATAVANPVTSVVAETGGARAPGSVATAAVTGLSGTGSSSSSTGAAASLPRPTGQAALGYLAAGAAAIVAAAL